MAAAAKIEQPKAELLSITQLAKRLKLHRHTVAARLEDLGYEPEPGGRPPFKLYRFDDEMEFALKSAKDTVTAIKIRDLRAAAELKEIKIAEAKRDLVPMHEVTELSQKLHDTVYREFGVQLPKRIAGRMVKATTVPQVTKLLKIEVDKVLKKLREADI